MVEGKVAWNVNWACPKGIGIISVQLLSVAYNYSINILFLLISCWDLLLVVTPDSVESFHRLLDDVHLMTDSECQCTDGSD